MLKPGVEQLEANLGKRAKVLRVSIHTDLGRKLRDQYAVPGVPMFLIFDKAGTEIYRGGLPTVEQVLAGESKNAG